jgi:hypothetical protein
MLKKKIVSTIEKRTIEKQRVIMERCFKKVEKNEIVEFRGEKTLDHFEELFERSAKDGVAFITAHFDDLDDKDIRKLV